MKTMTCKQLGGACNLEFKAETFEEIAEMSKNTEAKCSGKEMPLTWKPCRKCNNLCSRQRLCNNGLKIKEKNSKHFNICQGSMIRQVRASDSSAIMDIYNEYILNSISTFEEQPIDAHEMKKRIEVVITKYPWLVYEENNELLGYAYATQWKSRIAYRHTAESTVYLKQEVMTRGIGTTLYKELIHQLRARGIHAVIGGISLPNAPSIGLHEKMGFEKIAHFKEVGFKFNKWIDVGYWQLLL